MRTFGILFRVRVSIRIFLVDCDVMRDYEIGYLYEKSVQTLKILYRTTTCVLVMSRTRNFSCIKMNRFCQWNGNSFRCDSKQIKCIQF